MTDLPFKPGNILIDYTNHAGVRAVREIVPVFEKALRFGATEWHPDEQWLLDAHDVAKDDMRTFAMAGIHRWGVEPGRQMEIDLSLARQLQRSMELNASIRKEYGGKLRPEDGSVPALQYRADENGRSCSKFAQAIRDIVTCLDNKLYEDARSTATVALSMPWVCK
jgi:hypothetical protein